MLEKEIRDTYNQIVNAKEEICEKCEKKDCEKCNISDILKQITGITIREEILEKRRIKYGNWKYFKES